MNPSEKIIKELKAEIEVLESQLKEWENEPAPWEDHDEEMADAIYKFCYDCPVGRLSNCVTCYLNKWKNEKTVG